jgi:hypothetical protein
VILTLGAQSSAPTVYKVEFTVHDAVANSDSHYAMWIDESRRGLLQAGSRTNHIDVGTNIECSLNEASGRISLDGVVELSKITGTVSLGSIEEPIIGQRKVSFRATLDPGVETAIINEKNDAIPFQVETIVTKVR